jgi:hypothetical protein
MKNLRSRERKDAFFSIIRALMLGLPLLFSSVSVFAAPKPLGGMNVARIAGNKIVSLRATPFEALPSASPPVDKCLVTLKMTHPARPGRKLHRLIAANLKLIDGKGKNIELFTDNAMIGYGPTKHFNTTTLTESGFVLFLARRYATRNPLTLRGVIKVDNRWKVPFSVRLPPR